jgi:hypothetical protein
MRSRLISALLDFKSRNPLQSNRVAADRKHLCLAA